MSLSDSPFEWSHTKSGKLLISRGGKQVMIVSSDRAEAVLAKLGISEEQDQQTLARVTGQYRIGNERGAGSRRR